MLYPTGLEANGTVLWFLNGLFGDAPPPVTLPTPRDWDPLSAIDSAAPGLVVTRERLDAVQAAYVAGGLQPLTAAAIVAIVGPLPPYPSGLVRLADSNPAIDGWSIDRPGRN